MRRASQIVHEVELKRTHSYSTQTHYVQGLNTYIIVNTFLCICARNYFGVRYLPGEVDAIDPKASKWTLCVCIVCSELEYSRVTPAVVGSQCRIG